MFHELLIRLFDALVMGVMIAAYTSALSDYCKTVPPRVSNPPKLGRIPELS